MKRWTASMSGARVSAGRLSLALAGVLLSIMAAVGIGRAQGWGGNDKTGETAVPSVSVTTPMRLGTTPMLWLESGDVSIHAPRPRKSDAGRVDSLDSYAPASMEGAGRIVLREPRFLFGIARSEDASVARLDAVALAHLLEPLQRFAYDTVMLRDGAVLLRGPTGSLERLDHLHGEIAPGGSAGAWSAKGTFDYRGERVTYSLGLTLATASRPAGSEMPVRLELKSDRAIATFVGTMAFNATGIATAKGTLDLHIRDTHRFAAWFGRSIAQSWTERPLHAAGTTTWRQGVLTFDQALISIDGNAANGSLAINLTAPRPVVNGTLAFKEINVVRYILSSALGNIAGTSADGAPKTAAVPAPSPAAVAFSKARAGVGLLGDVDADLRISTQSIAGLGLPVGKTALSVAVRDAKLVADVAAMELEDGTAAGQIQIADDGNNFRMAMRGRLENVQIAPIAAAALAMPRSPLEGSANLTIDLAGRGGTLHDLVRTAGGRVSIEMPSGGKSTIDLGKVAADARSKRGLVWTDRTKGDASFDELTASIAVRAGYLISEDVHLRAGKLSAVGDGTVNLGTRRLFIRIFMDHGPLSVWSQQQDRRESVVLLGAWDNPSVRIESAGQLLTTGSTAQDGGAPSRPR